MAFTVADYLTSDRGAVRRIDRTVHVGILICPGTAPGGTNSRRNKGVTRGKLGLAAQIIRRDATSVFRPFMLSANDAQYHYQFAFELVVSRSDVPVQYHLNGPAPATAIREGLFRDAGHALAEARRRGLENIAVLVVQVPGPACAPRVSNSGEARPTGSSAPGLQQHTSNLLRLGITEELRQSELTPAHEVGHILGLSNCLSGSGIMSGGGHGVGRHRRFLPAEQELLHRAIGMQLTGISRPARLIRSAQQGPHRFPSQQR
ncbi:MAG: hypothetical protein ACLFU2_13580 [Opitutales bacterium]